jgi:hypothetical protein
MFRCMTPGVLEVKVHTRAQGVCSIEGDCITDQAPKPLGPVIPQLHLLCYKLRDLNKS